MKKIKIYNELFYLLAIIILAFAVAVITMSDFGVSMIVAPNLLLTMKFPVLTFGQWEYVTQAFVFIVMCIVIRKFKFSYLLSFAGTLIYGLVLDLFRLIPAFNTNLIDPLTLPIYLRIIYFIVGELLTAFSVAMFYKAYLPPQVPDFFVKAIVKKYNLNMRITKTVFDLTYLSISVALTFIFFGEIKGIGWGTVVITLINGTLINFFKKIMDKYLDLPILFPKIKSLFD